jgi:hypothetical protein
VVVVRHQTPGEDGEPVALPGRHDALHEALGLATIEERVLAVGDAVGDVEKAAHGRYCGTPQHGAALSSRVDGDACYHEARCRARAG